MNALNEKSRPNGLLTKRAAIVSVLLLLLSMNAWSQDYLPTLRDNAVWLLGRGQGMGSYSFFNVSLGCDSVLIDDKYYRLIEIDAVEYDCAPEIGYVREDKEERRVYYRSSMEDSPLYTEEVLIADYSLSVGDSIRVHDWGATLYVDSIYMKMWFDGQEYKYFELDNPHFSFYEGLGSQLYGVVPECHVYCFLFGYDLEGENCDVQVSVAEGEDTSTFMCFPNPVSDLLTISQEGNDLLDEVEIVIRDLQGRTYMTEKFIGVRHILDLGQLPTGVFIVSFYQDGQLLRHERISHHQ